MSSDPNFLDASGWIALINRTESLHVQANRIWRDLGKRQVVTFVTDWVAAETGNGLARSRCRDLLSKPACLHGKREHPARLRRWKLVEEGPRSL
jgi:predicted nucleic acid-binding protein